MNQSKKYIITASILGALAVVFGAMAVHALEAHLDERSLNAFKTASRYQMYHALAFLMLGTLDKYLNEGISNWVYNMMLTGVVLFSGSIYLLSTAPIFGMQFKFLGPVTPFGGLLLITSWILIGVAAYKNNTD